MPDIFLLSEADLRQVMPLDEAAIDCTENAFRALAGGGVQMPPVLSLALHQFNGEVDVKTAYIPGVESFAVKMSSGFFDNPKNGLPTASGLMVLFASRTGQVEALLLDNGYLTDVRTAAAGAVAARHLARADAKHAAILGAGMQARLQLIALAKVRPLQRAAIWGRNPDAARRLADDLTGVLGFEVEATTHAEDAVSDADIVETTTPTTEPIVEAEWLRPGQHITAMGSDQLGKVELEPACIARADLYVADRLSQTRLMGELRAALAAGVVKDQPYPELGQIVDGSHPGRTDLAQITIADLTGTGVQDTAIATLAKRRAQKAGVGVHFAS